MDTKIVDELVDFVSYNQKWWDELTKLYHTSSVLAFHRKAMNYVVAAAKELKIRPTWEEREKAASIIFGDMYRKYTLYKD